ncbi:unnamed protein product [Acanthoscelides obtectus]|uniref:Uncharacterized protein n=1 Tax=Acanthoscelides obtectus TaxID=200917 RepID=A0A9P0KLV5_ACAOB|nr:unnamed protein product [Acanthoscelides obtectus]CAK1656705.1 hypothetical protein AOBTE_LOCUS19876 [Acanthoscelides obtectus]
MSIGVAWSRNNFSTGQRFFTNLC